MKPQFGVLVVAFVSMIIFSSAGGIVYGVVTEEHSSPQFIAYELRRLDQYISGSPGVLADNTETVQLADASDVPAEYQALVKNTATLPDTTDTHGVLGVTTEDCSDVSSLVDAQQYGSIVNYLKMRGLPASYEARLQLATELKIENYTGSAAQNVELLNLLKVTDQEKIKVCTEQ